MPWAVPKEFTNNMSKLFYDHLVDLNEIEGLVKKHVKDAEARAEIYKLIDEIVHHRVVGCILDKLPNDHHKEFLQHVAQRAHDESILDFIKERVAEDVEEFIKQEIYIVGREILEMFDEGVQRHNLDKPRA